MSIARRLQALLTGLFRRDTVEAELDAEVREFYETMVERSIASGMTAREARRLAQLRFGHAAQVKEAVRDVRTGASVASLLRDVDYAFRTMRRTPIFALVVILTLAVGIGANATVFSIVSRFVLRAPPVGDPATLLAIHTTHNSGECCNNFTWPLFTDLRDQSKAFSGLAAYHDLFPASMGGNGEPERVWGQAVTANFFDVAQLPMTAGRGFARDEDNKQVIVLGHGLWQRRFAADPNITGRIIRLSGRPFTVVGVAPAGFRGLDFVLDCQFWVPIRNIDQLLPGTGNYDSRNYHWINVVGRLHPGVTQAEAAAELEVLARGLAVAHPESEKGGGFRFETAGSLSPTDRGPIMIFLAALSAVALLVLSIACANVANLSLAQAAGRQREMAVRLALGATRGRLLRQILTESLLLAMGGGVLGIALSLWATGSLAAFRFPAPVPLDLTVRVDWRVLLYSFTLCVCAGLFCGLAAAWTATRPAIAGALKGEPIFARARRFPSLRNLLVVSQIAMSLVLLCATGLFLRSLGNASRIDIGFRSSGLLMMSVDPRLHGYSAPRTIQFLDELRQRVARLPGVISAAYTDAVPLSGGHRSDNFQVEGRANYPEANESVDLYMVSPDYFDTMGTPRVAGADLPDVTGAAQRVAIVNQAFVRSFFRNEDPLGQRVVDGDRTYRIVGVVGNIKSRTIGEDTRPVLYRSLAQDLAADPSFSGYSLLVRFDRDPAASMNAVRREIRALDPTLAIFDAQTMTEHLRDALVLPRLAGTLFGVFGVIGLLLAAVGLYGVMSYWVSRRTREIGIRLAIGARAGEVQGLIVRQGLVLALIALVPGLAVAWALAKLFTSFLYGLPPHDVATFTTVPLFLGAIAFLASWIPARRAARVDPAITLRHD